MPRGGDRKSTRLNSSHDQISYAVFCLKKKESYAALEKMVAWTDGKKLFVDTSMKTGVADHIATDTIKTYNTFLERATGLTAKERSKRAQEAAKRGAA